MPCEKRRKKGITEKWATMMRVIEKGPFNPDTGPSHQGLG